MFGLHMQCGGGGFAYSPPSGHPDVLAHWLEILRCLQIPLWLPSDERDLVDVLLLESDFLPRHHPNVPSAFPGAQAVVGSVSVLDDAREEHGTVLVVVKFDDVDVDAFRRFPSFAFLDVALFNNNADGAANAEMVDIGTGEDIALPVSESCLLTACV